MKALVTGAAGFIGSTLTDRLLRDGADVLGIDSFVDYYPRALKERNLSAALGHPRFAFLESRVQDADLAAILRGRTHDGSKAGRGAGADQILNQAGTIARTRSGLPLPPTIFNGAAMTTAPTGGS